MKLIFGLALMIIFATITGEATALKYPSLKSSVYDLAAPPVIITPGEIIWSDGPSSLPPGAKFTIIEGDPKTPGELFTIRVKLPAGFKIAPHWHPVDEHVTVIAGVFRMGMGETFDPSKMRELEAGSFAVMPREHRHFAMAGTETIIQVHAVGPWAIHYVNPADDPRNQS